MSRRLCSALLALMLLLTAFSAPVSGADSGGAAAFSVNSGNTRGQYLVSDGFAHFFYQHLSDGSDTTLYDVLASVSAQPASPPAERTMSARYLVEASDYTRYDYALYEPNYLWTAGRYYTIDSASYRELKQGAGASTAYSVPLWLLFNPGQVARITSKLDGRPNASTLPSQYHELALHKLRSLQVDPSVGYKKYLHREFTAEDRGVNSFTLTFSNGYTFNIYIQNKRTLYLEVSDQAQGLQYTLTDTGRAYLADLVQLLDDPEWYMDTIPPATSHDNVPSGKPVIYLYPPATADVDVRLDFKGTFSTTIPTYDNGWRVTASPDGTLTNRSDGRTYPYLFWDGYPHRGEWEITEGFVVPGAEAETFLREKLPQLGLLPHEYQEFIDYWMPEMAANPYNLVTFATDEYEKMAPMDISPRPDTVIRVHMVFRPVGYPVSIPRQVLPPPPKREGFTAVEWGGTRAWLLG